MIADMVLSNGVVYTVDAERSWAEAVAIKGDTIIYVGKSDGLTPFIGPDTSVIDLEGKMILPAFFDAHAHAAFGGVAYTNKIVLFRLSSLEAYKEAIKEFVANHPDLSIVQGAGWSNTIFGVEGPKKEVLDLIEPDRPVAISSEDGHSLWVNSKALEFSGITKDTPDPEGGIIQKDPKTGEPTGALKESAVQLVTDKLPDYSIEAYMEGLLFFQKLANANGITTVHDPILNIGRSNMVQAYERLQKEGKLTIRFRGSWKTDPELGASRIADIIEERKVHECGPLFEANSIKFFIDGVIENETGWLLEPYAHRPDYYGEQLWDTDVLKETCAAADKAGFQIHLHVIGDAAHRQAIDALEYVQKLNGKRDSRHGITHLQLISPEDIKRMGELDILGYPNPYWFMVDDYFADLQLPYLGKERADKEYPMKSLIDAGVIVASASDFFVSEPEPLTAIQIGVLRTAPLESTVSNKVLEKGRGKVLWPEERVSCENMIDSVTINGAYANFLEKETGSIEVGKKADLVVLEKNILEIPPDKIADTKITMTLFEGKTVYQK